MNENVSNAIMDKFQFNVKNQSAAVKRLAIIPAFMTTLGLDLTKETLTNHDKVDTDVVVAVAKHYHDKSELVAAGYPVDIILDDATVDEMVMASANPTKKIRHFLDYIKTNPMLLKEITIISTDKSAFATDMEVAILDPFKRNPEQLIDMNTFYSKYQQAEDRIDLKFDKKELELSDVLLWTINVPAGADMSIILRF